MLFLPPPNQVGGRHCSANFNPIEIAFSKTKAHLGMAAAAPFLAFGTRSKTPSTR